MTEVNSEELDINFDMSDKPVYAIGVFKVIEREFVGIAPSRKSLAFYDNLHSAEKALTQFRGQMSITARRMDLPTTTALSFKILRFDYCNCLTCEEGVDVGIDRYIKLS